MILDNFNLKNKVAIVTGGAGHLGKAFTLALAEAGALVFVASKDKEEYEKTFDKKALDNIFFTNMDVASSVSIRKAFESIYKNYSSIDILVNCAVYLKGNIPEYISDEDFTYSADGVLGNVFRCIREIMPFMKNSKNGSIINIASMYGMVSPDFKVYNNYPNFLNSVIYGACKAGVIQMTKYFSVYLADYGIRVNSISPGAFPNLKVQEEKGFIDNLSNKIPLKRIGKPEDLKGALVFLASDLSNYVTGQNIVVDGGWTIW